MYNTDKEYWHRYIPEYERIVFSKLDYLGVKILEIGVSEGESIKLLINRFPLATIFGADIIAQKDSWPVADNVKYLQVDQNDQGSLIAMFDAINSKLGLIIDDGSHYPEHQAKTLKYAMNFLVDGGWYIIEDVHSSFWDLKASPLVLFLALKHTRDTDTSLNLDSLQSKYFSISDIMEIDKKLKEIHVYRRADLPLQCFRCGSFTFDYVHLRCGNCRENLYLPYDSMSLMLKF